nr:MAG TPA: hypothetical protein [Caudoviricetes sp.]
MLPSDRRKIIRNQQQHLFRIRLCEVQILTHLLGQIMLSACRRSMFWLYDTTGNYTVAQRHQDLEMEALRLR